MLDWGVAKVIASDPESDEPAPPSSERGAKSEPSDDMATSHGALLGTLGYMAPEQLKNASVVDARADVYALGAILCEILTSERLHPAERAVDLAETTMVSCAKRIRDLSAERTVPLELIELTVRATEPNLVDRVGSAEELVRAVERYLDGDRDLEARAKLRSTAKSAALALRTCRRHRRPARGQPARAKALRRADARCARPVTTDRARHRAAHDVWSPPRSDVPKRCTRDRASVVRVFQRARLRAPCSTDLESRSSFALPTKPKAYAAADLVLHPAHAVATQGQRSFGATLARSTFSRWSPRSAPARVIAPGGPLLMGPAWSRSRDGVRAARKAVRHVRRGARFVF